MDNPYENMSHSELIRACIDAKPGSWEAWQIHKALKKYGDGVDFFDLYIGVIVAAAAALVGSLLGFILVRLVL